MLTRTTSWLERERNTAAAVCVCVMRRICCGKASSPLTSRHLGFGAITFNLNAKPRDACLCLHAHMFCRYDFSRRQDLFSYEHTRGPLRLGAQYSFKASLPQS